jgi:outer membrane autotransporter protein
MYNNIQYRKWLTLVVMTYVMGSGLSVLASPVQSGQMVSSSNNVSSTTSPYDSIFVTQDSLSSSIILGMNEEAFVGIGQNSTTPLVVYLTNPSSGVYNVIVNNNGSKTTGPVETVGLGSLAAGAVTIHGPVAVQAVSIGAVGTKADAVSIGMGVGEQGTSIVTDAVHLSATAVGGDSNTSAKAKAQGIVIGNDNPVSNITLGTPNEINMINASALGGSASALGGGGTNVSASAYGVENYNVVDINGDTYINVAAIGGAPGGVGQVAGSATAEAYGVYNEGGSMTSDRLFLSTVKAETTRGMSVDSNAYGIVNKAGGTLQLGDVRLENVRAATGVADSGHLANANANGIYNEAGTVTTGAAYVKVGALAGTSDSGGSAKSTGIVSGKNVGSVSDLTIGTDTGSNEIYVLAGGGISTANDTNNIFTGVAFGILNNSSILLKGSTLLDVEAAGGSKAPANVSLGEAYALAYGIYNEGPNMQTGDLDFTHVQANANAGEEVHTEAFGVYNNADMGTIVTGNLNFEDISAYGGASITGGTADAVAYAVYNNGASGTFTAGNITGKVAAHAGYGGATANVAAIGISNQNGLTAKSVDLEVLGTAGFASDKARSQVAGITNKGTLTLTEGNNSLRIISQGGTSTGNSIDFYAMAFGINNIGPLTIAGPMTLHVESTGGKPDTNTANSTAHDAWAQAYGLYSGNGQVTTNVMHLEQITAQGGTGTNAQAMAVGLANQGSATVSTAAVNIDKVEAIGGSGSYYAFAFAGGIVNDRSFTTTDAAASNHIRVAAHGGTISGQSSAPEDAYAQAYGINNSGTMTMNGMTDIAVTALGGSGTAHSTNALALGIKNNSSGVLDINGPLTIKSTAASVAAGSGDGSAEAAGIANIKGTTNVKDTVDIESTAEGVSDKGFAAASLYAEGGNINVGTDGSASLDKIVKLKGDVKAVNDGTEINITLDQADSFLQGNVKEESDGQVHLAVSKGAVWRPVYDNRNGSFFNQNDSATFAKDYTVSHNSINRLNLADGGIVDLSWDIPARNPSAAARSLTIGRLSGNDGTFKVNSDLVHDKADTIAIAGADAGTTHEYIQVAYDPFLDANNLSQGSKVTGKAEVVSVAPDTISFSGRQGEYNLYQYTPIVVKDADGKWYITALTVGMGQNGTTGPVRTIGEAGMALQQLWLAETNSLEKRLGDLRSMDSTAAGIWTRYNQGKLQHDDTSLKYNLFQVGYDRDSASREGTIYRGLAISHASGDSDLEIASGDVKETTLSLYQTGIKDTGSYYDIIVKGGRYSNSYDWISTGNNAGSGDYHLWAYSISGEVGKRIRYDNGSYVEPQAELILGHLQGADYTTSTNMQARLDSQNKFIARLGVAAGREFKNGSIYGKVSYYHDFSGGIHIGATDGVDSVQYDGKTARNWGELVLGGSVKAGDNCQIYGEVGKFIGQLTSNVQFNVGARWRF